MTVSPYVLLLGALALAAGALIPVQAAANAALARSLGGSVPAAALVLFAVAAAAAGLALAAGGGADWAGLSAAPPWAYAGGLIVAAYVLTVTFLVPRLGVGAAIALIVTGQIVGALAVDHFGLVRAPVVPLTLPRALGAVLMAAGAFLALRR
jgi:transporter family-2 protein